MARKLSNSVESNSAVIPTGVSAPRAQPARQMPFYKLQEVDKFVQDRFANNVIRPSCSPWASPLVLIKKADECTRFCVDFRKLNEVTVGDTKGEFLHQSGHLFMFLLLTNQNA